MARRTIGVGVVGALAALVIVSLATGQPGGGGGAAGGGGGGGGGGAGFGGGNFDPAQFQQMMDDNNRQSMGATAEEWKVLGPKFNNVQTLTRSINGGGGMGMFGMRRGGAGGRGGRGGMGMMGGEPTALDKARDTLYTALDNTSATPEQLQQALKTFRDAKDKAKKELATAQADLKKTLTVKQEVTLVAMGLLD